MTLALARPAGMSIAGVCSQQSSAVYPQWEAEARNDAHPRRRQHAEASRRVTRMVLTPAATAVRQQFDSLHCAR